MSSLQPYYHNTNKVYQMSTYGTPAVHLVDLEIALKYRLNHQVRLPEC